MSNRDLTQLGEELRQLRGIVEAQQRQIAALTAERATRQLADAAAKTAPEPESDPERAPDSPSRRSIIGRAVAASLGVGFLARPSRAQFQAAPVGGGAFAASTSGWLQGYTGAGNTAFGHLAGILLDPSDVLHGRWNTALGVEALMQADPGGGLFGPAQRNSATGRGALRDLRDGYYNDAFGADAGRHSNRSNRNTFLGNNSGKWVGSLDPQADLHPTWSGPGVTDIANQGCRNVMIGRNAGHWGVTAQSCVTVGYNAGAHFLTNDGTTAVGRNSMLSSSNANRTVCVGAFTMSNNTAGGDDTVAIGYEAMMLASGNNNVAIGAFAGRDCLGGQNVYIGEQAGIYNQNGSDNVMVGRHAGLNSDGSGNIFLGRMAGRDHSGRSSTLIIHNTSSSAPFLEGSMGESSQWWLRVRGDVTPNADAAWSLGSSIRRWKEVWSQDGTINTSDARLKEQVVDEDLGLAFIESLRPVVWKWKGRADRSDHRGLIAQEVQQAAERSASERDFAAVVDAGGQLGLREREFLGPMIKALQELSERVKQLDRERG